MRTSFLILFVAFSSTAFGQYAQLETLYTEWRDFVRPAMNEGVPNYTQSAMNRKYIQLTTWQNRLEKIDTAGWPVADKVDWTLVWSEMNGFKFEHEVTRPWERDPAFYRIIYTGLTDVPEREGPNIEGAIELAYLSDPLTQDEKKSIQTTLANLPKLYEQARLNLTGNARDLWVLGTKSIRQQVGTLESLAAGTEDTRLRKSYAAAAQTTQAFAAWLETKSDAKTGPSGIGKGNYSWNLKNVHLIPYTWEETVLLLERELTRAHTALLLEENRLRSSLPLQKIDNAKVYNEAFRTAIEDYIEFLEEQEIVSMPEYKKEALRKRINTFTPSDGLRGFFSEVHYRDPIVMRTHDYHWMDLAMLREDPHERIIRSQPLLYNIFDGRAEGMATGMEELMLHAGFVDDRPEARMLIWILLAQRAARGLAALYQHGLEMSFEEATQFASKWTPWGLLPADGSTIQGEEHFYLQQPGYGTSYVTGKIELEKLVANVAQVAKPFVWQQFFDTVNSKGIIPIALIQWEMTGIAPSLNQR